MPNDSLTKITHLVFLGDSLSDRGTLNKRRLFELININSLIGLSGKSPRGRFTNGFLWGDYVVAATAEKFAIDAIRKERQLSHTAIDNADLSDMLITNDRNTLHDNELAFSLDDDMHVLFKGERFARFYCEGGLTSHDYWTTFTFDMTDEIAREIVSTLNAKRKLLLEDDDKMNISVSEKSETLVMEWSGANDLLTVNENPTIDEVDRAIADRMQNIEELIQRGYRHFVLVNLPDLALTPRFQTKNADDRVNCTNCVNHFNSELLKQCQLLVKKYSQLNPDLSLSVFDVNSLFSVVYEHPEEYGFDKDKLKSCYTQSLEFIRNASDPVDQANQTSPSTGYMFWDDIHPTADMHAILAANFQERYSQQFQFEAPIASQNIPDDVKDIIEAIRLKALSMRQSTIESQRKKGHLLLHALISDIEGTNGDLDKMHKVISTFIDNKQNMTIISEHKNPLFDFLANKKNTRTEDEVGALLSAVSAHKNKPRV